MHNINQKILLNLRVEVNYLKLKIYTRHIRDFINDIELNNEDIYHLLKIY